MVAKRKTAQRLAPGLYTEEELQRELQVAVDRARSEARAENTELAQRAELALSDFGTVEGALEAALIDEVTNLERLRRDVVNVQGRIHDLKLRIRILQAIER